MPLVMQLDGPPRHTAPQLFGFWSDVWGGITDAGSAAGDALSLTWDAITDRKAQPVRIARPARIAPSASVRGPFGVLVPATSNYYVGLLASNPWIPLLLGIGAGVFLATRKGKKR